MVSTVEIKRNLVVIRDNETGKPIITMNSQQLHEALFKLTNYEVLEALVDRPLKEIVELYQEQQAEADALIEDLAEMYNE